MAKHVYLLEVGNLNRGTNRFEFYDKLPFTSKKLMEEHVTRRIKCNSGTNIVRDTINDNVHYDMLSYDSVSIDGRPMKIRYLLRKLELNKY